MPDGLGVWAVPSNIRHFELKLVVLICLPGWYGLKAVGISEISLPLRVFGRVHALLCLNAGGLLCFGFCYHGYCHGGVRGSVSMIESLPLLQWGQA